MLHRYLGQHCSLITSADWTRLHPPGQHCSILGV